MEYFIFDNPYFIAGCVFIFFLYFLLFIYGLFLKFLYFLGLRKIAHYLYAAYSWYDIWLIDKCPYEDCSKCKAWTCPAYDKYHRKWCKCKNREEVTTDDIKTAVE